MVCVLLLASFFYLKELNAVSFWEDESWMAIAIRGDLPGVWTFAAEKGLHPPLYFLLAWFFAQFTGDSEVALRWMGGLWALAGIAFTYRLGADLYTRKTGVFAALLVAGSLFLAYFSRNARHYTAFYTLAAGLIWAYESWRRAPDSWRKWWTVVLLQTALLYTHYFGAWLAVVIGLHSGLCVFVPALRGGLVWRGWLKLLGGLALSGVLFAAWIPALVGQFRGANRGLGYAVTESGAALSSYLDAVFNANYLLGGALLVLGFYATWRWRRQRAGILLILWAALPTALTLLLNPRFQLFVSRNLLFTLGAVAVLFGAGLAYLANWRAGRWAAGAAGIVFAVLGMSIYPRFWNFSTPDWRSAAREMAVDARSDDVFVLRAEPYSLDYYLSRHLQAPVSITPLIEWLRAPSSPDRLWLIDGDWAVRFEAIDALAPDMRLMQRVVVLPVVAELYLRPPQREMTVFAETFTLAADYDAVIEAAAGQPLTLDLWWRALQKPDFDYSAGVYVVADDGAVIAQTDGAFDRGRVNATSLPVGDWTHDARTLDIPTDAPPGDYRLLVGVYDWRDGSRLKPLAGRADDLYPMAIVRVR